MRVQLDRVANWILLSILAAVLAACGAPGSEGANDAVPLSGIRLPDSVLSSYRARARYTWKELCPEPVEGACPEPVEGACPEPVEGACPEPVEGACPEPVEGACPEPVEGACPEPVEGACPEPVEGACPEPVEGVGQEGYIEIQKAYTRQPHAEHRLLLTSMDGKAGEWVLLQGVLYSLIDGVWTAASMGGQGGELPGDIPDVDPGPEGLLSGLEWAHRLGAETVNGIACVRYRFDGKDLSGPGAAILGLEGANEFQGQLWIAEQGNYLVKLTLEATGRGLALGGGAEGPQEGRITVLYELKDANERITIRPPKKNP
jgi:hypothetical protein